MFINAALSLLAKFPETHQQTDLLKQIAGFVISS